MSCEQIRRSARLAILMFLLVALLGPAVNAHAAEESGNPAESPIGELFKWLNFAVVAGAVGYLCMKKGPSFFRRRADATTAAITQATATKAEAERQLQDAESRLARLDLEAADLRAHAQRDAQAEAERVRALTRAEAEKISAAARAEIQAAERAARLELKAFGAQLAVAGAESLLTKQLTPQTQDSLFRAFVHNLEGGPN